MLGGRQAFRELCEARAASIVMLDLGWCGGLSEGKAIASMAEAFGLPVAPHDCTGPVVWMASVHLSLNAPNALIQETVRAFFTGWYTELVSGLAGRGEGNGSSGIEPPGAGRRAPARSHRAPGRHRPPVGRESGCLAPHWRRIVTYECAFCGEENEVLVDPSGGRRQTFTEDCAVCCRPNLIALVVDEDGDVELQVTQEYEA